MTQYKVTQINQEQNILDESSCIQTTVIPYQSKKNGILKDATIERDWPLRGSRGYRPIKGSSATFK